MSTLTDTDLFLVQSNGQLHKITSDQMSNLNDTDLLLVEREGVQYKLEAKDLELLSGELETPVEVLTPLNGAGVGELMPYTPISKPIVTVGGGGSLEFKTSAITNVEEEVEQSTWNQSQTWSNQFTTTGSVSGSLTAIVDGIITFDAGGGPSYDGVAGNPSATITWSVPAGLTGSVKVFGTPANYQYGYGATISASNGFSALDNTGDWVYVGEAENLSWITVSGNAVDFGPAWQGIEVGGQRLVDPQFTDTTPTGNEILTFVDSTNFDKFQPGDVVQHITATVSTSDGVFYPDRGADKLFDNSGLTLCGSEALGVSPVGTTWLEVKFNPPYAVSSSIDLRYWDPSHLQQLSINGGAYSEIEASNVTSIPFSGEVSTLRFSTISAGRAAACSGIGFDGTFFQLSGVPTQLSNPVTFDVGEAATLISIDSSNSKMVVDGGNWAAINDSQVWSSAPYNVGNSAEPSYPATKLLTDP